MTMMSSSSSAEEDGPPVPTRTKSALTGSLAEKMMKSMGWKEGQGLGKTGEGITTHVTVERRLEGQGLGLELDSGGNSAFGSTQAGFSSALASLSAKYGAPGDAADDSDASSDDDDDEEEEEETRRPVKRTKKFVAPRGHHKKKDLKSVDASDLRAILGGASSSSGATKKAKKDKGDKKRKKTDEERAEKKRAKKEKREKKAKRGS